MVLLAPMAALIAAAIAFPILAIFYLLKLRRRPVRISSTLLWQQAYEDLEANIPWRWVRPSWLVLLHALLVALVVLAIGRPAIHAHGPAASRMVFIIDRSASMSALDGDPRLIQTDDGAPITRLREAQARARAIIDDSMRMGRRIEAAVISIAAEAQGLTPMTSDRRLLQETIAGITPTDQPLDLQQALRLAEAILGKRDTTGSEPADPEAAPLVIFLSDGSLPAGEPLSISGAALRLERVGPPPELAVTASDFQPAGRDNVGITTLSARRDEANPAVVRVFVQIASALRRPRDLPITVSLAGIERQRRAIEVPAATDKAPGSQAATFEIQTRDAGVLTVALIADDLLASDNQASLLLDAPRSPAILLVVPDESPTDQAATVEEFLTPAWLLESILTELRPARLHVAKASEANGLIRASAGAFDLIVLDRTTPPILPPVPTLSLGAGLPSIGITISPATAGTPDRDFILSWERSHPILRDVSLDTVFALAPASIQFAPIDLATTGELQRTDLALGASGPMISLLETGGGGGGVRHIVLAFDLGRSNWGLQVGFPIFLVNALDFLTLRGSQQSAAALRTADPIELAAPANLATIVLEGPIRREIRLPDSASTASAERTASVGRLERAGIYTAQPSRVRPVIIPVSLLDPLESALGVSEQINIRSRGSAGDDRAAPSLPREIGDYLLLAALGLLIVEWIVYTRSARV